jgi:hypothetical protein
MPQELCMPNKIQHEYNVMYTLPLHDNLSVLRNPMVKPNNAWGRQDRACKICPEILLKSNRTTVGEEKAGIERGKPREPKKKKTAPQGSNENTNSKNQDQKNVRPAFGTSPYFTIPQLRSMFGCYSIRIPLLAL